MAFTANPALVGTDFTNNYPDFFSDLWDMDRGFIYLSTGLPRWTPFPPITRAHAARNRMHTALRGLEEALDKDSKGQDPGTEWHALDDVSSLVKARAEVYRKYDFSIKGRAAFETALLWAMNANANPLVFWMIVRIYADSSLLARLREEVAPYVRVVEPPRDFGIPEPLRLESVDHEGLINKCPLLKSCYIESLRLDTAIYGFRVMKEDLILSGRDKTADKLMLKKGTYAHVANDIHHKDPQYFDDAETWRADRHVRYDEGDDGEKTVKVDMGTVKPFGTYMAKRTMFPSWHTKIRSLYMLLHRRRTQHVQGPSVCSKGGGAVYGCHHQLLGDWTGRWRAMEDAEADKSNWHLHDKGQHKSLDQAAGGVIG